MTPPMTAARITTRTNMTAKHKLIAHLYKSERPLAVHEIQIEGVSQTSASARLREMRRDGIVVKTKAEGKAYDLWSLAQADLTLFQKV